MKYIITSLLLWTLISLSAQQDVTLSYSKISTGTEGDVQISVSNAQKLAASDFRIEYDPKVVEFISATTRQLGTNGMIAANVIEEGVLLIGWTDSDGVSGSGELINISFKGVGTSGTYSTLALQGNHYDTEAIDIISTHRDGMITITGTSMLLQYLPYLLGILLLLILIPILMRSKKKKAQPIRKVSPVVKEPVVTKPKSIPPKETKTPPPVEVKPESTRKSPKNYCAECGEKLNPGSKFCPNCGTKV